MSQTRLAELINSFQSVISDWEADWKLPNEDSRKELARATNGELPLSMWDGIERAARKPSRADVS